MKTIFDADKNFKIETNIQKEDIVFFNVLSAPIRIYGLIHENGMFRRMPERVAGSVSEGVHFLHANTAGGRARLKTDSKYIAIVCKMGCIGKMPHFALTGSAGFDLYEKVDGKEVYKGSFLPPFNVNDGYESVIELGDQKIRELTINFPLYTEIKELYIGISSGASLEASSEYSMTKPIVYYGSSITQGGCASRPGNSYQSIISRRFNCDYINLGFSGNAKAEEAITDYIKSMKMSLFVYDYDHNAPSVEHLKNTHEKMFAAIRKENPELPIIMMSRPKWILNGEEKIRRSIVEQTYTNALSVGDKNVYYIPGNELMKYAENEGTVDNCHPNDLGFASMARALGDEIEKILFQK